MMAKRGHDAISVAEALRRLEAVVTPAPGVEAALEACHALVLAEDVAADRDFPPTDRSAMDGFAVRSVDAASAGILLAVSGEVRAGQDALGADLSPGRAVRVFTGSVLPAGADAVVMVEHVEEDREARTVRLLHPVEAAQHVRRQASDLSRGAVLLRAGSPIHAAEIAALAAVGRTRVRVHRPPVIGVISTGDEVVELDRAPRPHQVRNSNAATLLAQARETGVRGAYLGHAADAADELRERIERGLAGDVLLVTGGVSVGDYDLVAAALAEFGAETLFHGVRMKPGMPVLAARRGSCLIFGLPGNPVSTFTCFAVLVAPSLRRMLGYRDWRDVEIAARLESALEARPGRETYHLAQVVWREGRPSARRVDTTGSGDLPALARANAFLVTPAEGGSWDEGDELPALLWPEAQRRSGPGPAPSRT